MFVSVRQFGAVWPHISPAPWLAALRGDGGPCSWSPGDAARYGRPRRRLSPAGWVAV